MISGFNYIKNCFFIEDLKGVVSNSIIFDDETGFNASVLMGKVFNLEQLEKKISVNHELNHYIQDLSINACITEGFFIDYLSAYSRELSNNSSLRFPLMNPANREFNEGLLGKLDEKDKAHLATLYQIYDVYKYIYRDTHIKPMSTEYDLGDKLNSVFAKFGISLKYILESYAYHKAYNDCFLQDAECDDKVMALLAHIIKKDKVYPWQYRNGCCLSEHFKCDIDYKAQYQYLDFLLTISCLPVSIKEYLDYCEYELPYNYRNSVVLIAQGTQRTIIETALNIPSFDFIMSSIDDGRYDMEVFSPVHRIYKIIKTVRDNNGYPAAKNGEDYFKTFFNWCSELNNWPSYEETMRDVYDELSNRAELGKECITNFKMNAITQKDNAYGKFSHSVPIELLSKLALPLIISNKQGLVSLQLMGGFYIDPLGLLDFYQVWFNMPVYKYAPTSEQMPLSDLYKTILNNQYGAIREILHRLFSKAATNTLTEHGYFKCPLAENGCKRKTDSCKKFKKFSEVLKNCKKIILRIGEYKSFQGDDGIGNFPDCMFLNYVVDDKYNLKNLNII